METLVQQRCLQWLFEQKNNMLGLVKQLAAINSSSYNNAGINTVAELLLPYFEQLGVTITRTPSAVYQTFNHLGKITTLQSEDFITINKDYGTSNKILLGGHLDTVYSKSFPITTNSSFLYGPGVADMKGGLVVMLYALLALERYSNHKLSWQVFLTADEEIGSIGASQHLAALAREYPLCFIYEPALDLAGNLVGARMGSGKFTLIVKGQAAHVGRNFAAGKSAIIKLAELSLALHTLNHNPEIIVNIGNVHGGDAVNCVPDFAMCKIDVRVATNNASQWFEKQLQQLLALERSDGYEYELHGGFYRPNKPLTNPLQALLQHAQTIISQLEGNNIMVANSGGCCDGNNIAQAGCITLDTLGVCGANIHSKDEYMVIDSLVTRAQLSVTLLLQHAAGVLIDE